MMTSTPRCISTTVCTTAPPSKTREAPWVRLVRPDVTAASWSARSWGNPAENASGSPSEDTTTAWATSGTRSTKFVISQLRSWTGRPGVLTRAPLLARTYRLLLYFRWLYSWVSCVLWLLVLGSGGTRFANAALEARHPVADRLRRPNRWRALRRLLAAADRAGHEVRPGYALRQSGRGGLSSFWRCHDTRGPPSFVGRRVPALPRSRRRGRAERLAAPPEPVGL